MRPASRRALAALLATLLTAPLAAPAAAQQAGTHTVQPGETLWQIASDAGVDPGAILRLNQIDDGDLIRAGQVLKLPTGAAPAATPAPPPAPTPVVHTVVDGENLWGIAQAFGTTVDAIQQANSLNDGDVLVVGTNLTIPGGRPAPSTPAPAATSAPTSAPAATPAPAAPASSGRKTLLAPYTIQPGETLGAIARQFGVSADAIAQASGLNDPNKLSVGAVLKVPIPSRDHVIQTGETLYGIAAQEKVDLGSLIDFNNVSDPSMIRVGDVLVIPGSATQTAASLPDPTPSPTPPPPPPPTAPPAATSAPTPAPRPTPAATKPAASPSPTPKPSPTPAPARRSVAVPAGLPTDGIVGQAVQLLGYPYVFGGSGPTSFDCSGLIWYAAKMAGKPISRGLFGQYNSGSHPSRDDLKPGDLVFFQNTYMPGLSHDGIYIGNGQFINAANEVSGVTISDMSSTYWSSRYFGATRPS